MASVDSRQAVLRMFNGRMVDVFNLRVEDIVPANFVHACSCINRYTGNTKRPYSVAEHSMLLANVVPDRLYRAALIHDWTEPLINDMPSPVKAHNPAYKAMEQNIHHVIYDAMGVHPMDDELLKPYDTRIRGDEMLHLFDPPYFDADNEPLYGVGPFMDHASWQYVKQRYADSVRRAFPEVNFG